MTTEVLQPFRPLDVEEIKRLDKLAEEFDTQPWHPRETYLALPKAFGAVESGELMELAAQLDASNNPRDLEIAGSAMIEARLFSPYRTEETTDDDEFIVQYGSLLLQQSAEARWNELERGLKHYNDQTDAIRTEVKAAFAPMYFDLLQGEVTHEAREQTYSRLAYWGRYILKHGEHYGSYGLAYEIATLMGGLTDEAIIMLPATPRGDSGIHHPDATHDFTYLTLQDGAIESTIGFELKNDNDEDRRLQSARRYNQRRVVVLDANHDLELYKNALPVIFGQRSLTQTARRNLSGIRSGVYARAQEASRRYGSRYKEKTSA